MSYLLYINSTEQQLWRKVDGQWQPWDGEPDSPVWIVTDLPEESFTDIKMPRLFGRDRSAFIARQLATAFPDTPYRSYLTPVQAGGLLGLFAPTRQILFGISAAERLNSVLASISAPIAGVWPISMLLAQMCKGKDLPDDLLIALPGPDTLRIVYLRNRSPVIARLTSTPDQAAAQVDELIRTLRYLENAQILPRDRKLHAVLFLGDNSGLEGLVASANLKLVRLPQKKALPTDWRLPLFDIVLKSPAGQLAPMDKRIDYLSQQLGKTAFVAAIILVLLGVGVAGSNLYAAYEMRNQKQALEASTQQLQAQLASTDQAINHFNVAPDLVRHAIALHDKEIASVPPLDRHLQLIANLLADDPSLRLSALRWRLLKPAQPACIGTADANPADPNAEAAPTGNETRKVEISFELTLPDTYGPRDRAAVLRSISGRIASIQGVSLLKDAVKDFAGGSLRGGSDASEASKPTWCLTLPGMVETAAVTTSAVVASSAAAASTAGDTKP